MIDVSQRQGTPERPGQGQASPVRVLLVDDEEGFIAVLAKRLGKRGLTVRTASGGGEAIRILRRHDFDVAVLDLKLEDMDGIEILKVFKQMAPDMPVIMLTGHGCEIAAREGLRLGAVDYLTKPCDFETLVRKITAVARAKE
ncbi:MAG: response regulator [Desulfobacterales bacterium]|nr:response regulator [Desulfobacterales bacterium]